MADRVDALRARLEDTRTYLNDVLDRVNDRWEEQVYADGLQWTVRQLVNHLSSADSGHNAQAMNIAEGRDIIPEDFDVERYNASTTRKSAQKTAQQARAELDASRQELLDWLDTIDEKTLDKRGRHASLQIMSVEQILQHLANHELMHAQDIATALEIDTETPQPKA